MNLAERIKYLLHLTRSHGIVRRYFVVNGFDGALTMLGLIIGFLVSGTQELSVIINACLGAAIALGTSGVSSAYISETAERRRALIELERAMVADLGQSAHGAAAREVPWLIAIVNGSAPLLISLLIISPLFLAQLEVLTIGPPLYLSVAVAIVLIFMLGIYLGRIAGVSWVRGGFQTLAVAVGTMLLIYFATGA